MSWAFEHLRALIRRGGETGRDLAVDVAQCIEEFDDQASLVMALRRVCAQRPDEAPLWWVCARVLCASDWRAAAIDAADALLDDDTVEYLAEALPFPHDDPIACIGDAHVVAAVSHVRPDLDLVAVRPRDGSAVRALRHAGATVRVVEDYELTALAPSHVVVAPQWAATTGVWATIGTADALHACPDAKVWLVVPRGRALPDALTTAMSRAGDPLEPAVEALALATFAAAVGPHGTGDVRGVLAASDCPVAPELLRLR